MLVDTQTMRREVGHLIPFLAMLATLVLVVGCQSSDEQTGNVASASIPWSEVPPAQSGAGVLPTPPAPNPATVEVAPDSSLDPAGPALAGVTASGVHLERHDGFDRIVYDFGGTYAPPWHAEYVAEASQRGEQTSTRLAGRSILQIHFFDTVSAAESGIVEYSGPNPVSDPAAHSVVEVLLTPNFEGATQSFVGLRTEYPRFQVTTLTAPTRIAVDIFE